MGTKTVFHGSSMVLMLMVSLCAMALGVLAMVSAYADFKLADTAAGRVGEYYLLEGEANEHVKLAADSLKAGREPDGWTRDGDTLWRDVIVGTQGLRIELRIVPDGVEITRWTQWQADFEYNGGVEIWLG